MVSCLGCDFLTQNQDLVLILFVPSQPYCSIPLLSILPVPRPPQVIYMYVLSLYQAVPVTKVRFSLPKQMFSSLQRLLSPEYLEA